MSTPSPVSMMTLGQKQDLFALKMAELTLWVYGHKGWTFRHGEGRIMQLGASGNGRKAKKLGLTILVRDAEHMEGSTHYAGLGEDRVLTIDGIVITLGWHPAWAAIGERWESNGPEFAWGGRWNDGNHLSIRHLGAA